MWSSESCGGYDFQFPNLHDLQDVLWITTFEWYSYDTALAHIDGPAGSYDTALAKDLLTEINILSRI